MCQYRLWQANSGELSADSCFQVRDWYVESFKDLRSFPKVSNTETEREFTGLLQHIYNRHRNVVPVMAMGVAELKQELSEEVKACTAHV